MRRGFTLIELSIAFVIIGMLIGGILIGQSLVTSARVMNQIKQLQEIQIAVRNFKLAYKQLPGDANILGQAGAQPERLTSGDTDGRIRGQHLDAPHANDVWRGAASAD